MKNKLELANKNFDIVGKRKITFAISAAIIFAGIIAMIVSLITTGKVLNLGVDFEGGYSMEIASASLTEDNFVERVNRLRQDVENLTDSDGNRYNLEWKGYRKEGDTNDLKIHFSFSIIGDTEKMEQVSKDLKKGIAGDIELKFSEDEISDGGKTESVVSQSLVNNAIITLTVSLILMLAYVAVRFEFASGLAAVVGLFHDVLIMIAIMAIFRIEVNSTFIAAMITIIGLSINNIIIVFDRLRETVKNQTNPVLSGEQYVNKAVNDTLVRSILYSLTSFVTIFMVGVLGVYEVRIFAVPIMVGLIAGTYSSIFISPTLWALRAKKSMRLIEHYQKRKKGKAKINKAEPIV